MSPEAITVETLRQMVGKEGKPAVLEIEKGMVRKFAEAIGDPNPLWQDEQYAKKSRYKGIVAPPQIFCASMLSGAATRPDIPLPYKRILDGGGEWEFFLPVKPGDIITSITKFADVLEREGKAGKMAFLIFETTHQNQRGEIVAKSRGTLINLE